MLIGISIWFCSSNSIIGILIITTLGVDRCQFLMIPSWKEVRARTAPDINNAKAEQYIAICTLRKWFITCVMFLLIFCEIQLFNVTGSEAVNDTVNEFTNSETILCQLLTQLCLLTNPVWQLFFDWWLYISPSARICKLYTCRKYSHWSLLLILGSCTVAAAYLVTSNWTT